MNEHSLRYFGTILKDGVLRFGDFTTKSGRQSPYFFNTGRLCSAHSLGTAAEAYAHLVQTNIKSDISNFYGPAYKGIPLAVAVSLKYAHLTGKKCNLYVQSQRTERTW